MTAKHALEDGHSYQRRRHARRVQATRPSARARAPGSHGRDRARRHARGGHRSRSTRLADAARLGRHHGRRLRRQEAGAAGPAVGRPTPWSSTGQLVYALLAVGIMLLVGFPVHEFCHAFAAYRLGDSTARWQGRLTLDPAGPFRPGGRPDAGHHRRSSAHGAFFFGYAKPTPVNPMNLRGGRHGEALVAAAGPLSNLVMAAIVAIPLRLLLRLAAAACTRSSPAWPLDGARQRRLLLRAHQRRSCSSSTCCPCRPWTAGRCSAGSCHRSMAWQLRNLEQQYAQIIPLIFLAFILLAGARIIGPIADFVLIILLLLRLFRSSAERGHVVGRQDPPGRCATCSAV